MEYIKHISVEELGESWSTFFVNFKSSSLNLHTLVPKGRLFLIVGIYCYFSSNSSYIIMLNHIIPLEVS